MLTMMLVTGLPMVACMAIVTEIVGTWKRPHWIVVIMIVNCSARTGEYCNSYSVLLNGRHG
jgi:NADH:ubiquinone oxidoreductase subunit B-like Fe-S oxidoreductase